HRRSSLMAAANVRSGGVKTKFRPRNERKDAMRPPASPPAPAAVTTERRYSMAALVGEEGDLRRGIEAIPVATTGNSTPARIWTARARGPDLAPSRGLSAVVRMPQV